MPRNLTVRIATLITVIIITSPCFVTAEWPYDPQVNLPIAVESNNQTRPKIIGDGNGGAIIVWGDRRSGPSSDIYAQRVNAAGVPLWTTNGVAVCDANGSQIAPQMISDGAGGAIVAWYDNRNGANYIYAQRLNGSGVPLWADNGVTVSSADATESGGKMIADDAGGAIIVWNDGRSGLGDDIYAQRINAAGVTQWTANGVVVCDATNTQFRPDLIGNGSGGAYIVWVDYRSGSESDIYVQGINSGGNIVWPWSPDGIAVCQAVNSQYEATIVRDGASGAFISWVDERSLGQYADIYLQRINASGVIQWPLNGNVVCAAGNDQNQHTMISDGTGGVIVTWSDLRSNTLPHIYAQRMSGAGLPLWQADGVPVSNLDHRQGNPDITFNGAGQAIITWINKADILTPTDIYVQRLNALGVSQWSTGGVIVSNATGNQLSPRIVSDGRGGVIIAWEDMRNGADADIYAQRIYYHGSLKAPSPLFFPIKSRNGKVSVIYLD